MMALAGVELETLVSDTDALTTRPPPLRAILMKYLTKKAGQYPTVFFNFDLFGTFELKFVGYIDKNNLVIKA